MSRRKNITKTTTEPKPLVVNQIIVKSPTRKVYDVGTWRNALKSADSGRVKPLYDLYDDILIDGLLSDAVEKRIDAVLNAELTFQNDKGQDVEEITAIMDTPDFEEILRQIMNERIYGRSAFEMLCSPDYFKVEPIPAKHIHLKNRCILINDSDEKGISYEGDNSLLILGRERNFGLLLKATPYAIYKRGGFGDWSQWVELFGMPQRVGKYNSYDPESRKLLERAMEEAGSAPYIIIPKEAEVETKASNSGSGTSYNEFRQACNEEMLITMLGQTLTTVQGENGARSLGEVHKEVEEGKNKSDMRFVQRILNTKVLPMLEARGYPVTNGKFIFPKAAESLTVSDIVQLSEILPIPQSFLHEKYSIPVPTDNEPIARRQIPALQTEITPDTPSDSSEQSDSSTSHKLSDSEKTFFQRLRDFFVQALTTGATSTSTSLTLKDNPFDKALIQRVASKQSTYFDAQLFQMLSKDFLKAIQTAFKKPVKNADGYTYDDLDQAFVTALEQNIFHFSAAKTLAEVQQLNQTFRESKNLNEFSKKAETICNKFNKAWQKTEYDTAVLTAESAANYQRLKAKQTLFPYWKYVTAGDEKVREEHKKLNGVTLPAKDPRWDKIFPPNGWNCRCRVVPMMKHEVSKEQIATSQNVADEYMQSDEWGKISAQHFDVNIGKRAEIFNKDQMYIRKFPDQAAKLMKKVKPADWGLNHSYKQLIHDSKAVVKEYEGTPKDWWDNHKTIVDSKEVIIAEDYNKRQWIMAWKEFNTHSTNEVKSREKRRIYLDCIDEVMKHPDEVWLGQNFKDKQMNDYQLTQWLYIKYYNEVALVCVCKIQKGKLVFKSWHELKDTEKRKGILIYRK